MIGMEAIVVALITGGLSMLGVVTTNSGMTSASNLLSL